MQTSVSAAPVHRPGFLAVHDLGGWQIKTYGIASTRPRPELVGAAERLAASVLPERPDLDGAYGIGFMIIHDTKHYCLVTIDWWMRTDELFQRAFVAPPDEPRSLQPLTTPAIGRMSGLAVLDHERQAWIRNVLERPGGPDIDGYLADVLR